MLQVLVQAADPGMYRVHSHHFLVPCLAPLLQYTFKVGGVEMVPGAQRSAAQHDQRASQPDAAVD